MDIKIEVAMTGPCSIPQDLANQKLLKKKFQHLKCKKSKFHSNLLNLSCLILNITSIFFN